MCCTSLLKTMMFIFNGCIFLAGAVVLGVGIWVKVDSGSLFELLENLEDTTDGLAQLSNVAYLVIGVGAVLLTIGFLGCCGAIRESRCMLMTFFIIVLIIFIAEVAAAVLVFFFETLAADLLGNLESSVVQNIEDKYGEDESLTNLWNSTMDQFQCCGFRNYKDFNGTKFFEQGQLYPTACCNSTDVYIPCTDTRAQLSKIDGCFNKLLKLIEDNALIVGAVALGVLAIEIAAMVVSMVLYKDIGRK